MGKYYLGIDLGSTTLKCAIMKEDGEIFSTLYERTKPSTERLVNCSGRCFECGTCSFGSVKKSVNDFLKKCDIEFRNIERTVVTGSQIVNGSYDFIHYNFFVSEVTAHISGATFFYPNCKAILDVGGQDSKAMLYNEDMKMWTSRMSGICAAGTGAFLDSVANKINIPVEDLSNKVDFICDTI